jgi:hypothetical protein
MYFIIYNSDGDTRVEQFSKEELTKRITPDGDGDTDYGDAGFIEELKESDTNFWGENMLIIKGDIVSPKAKDVVKSYEID